MVEGCPADRLVTVVAGGVFKAGLAASTWFGDQGLLSAIIRVVWLWGATGLLLSPRRDFGKDDHHDFRGCCRADSRAVKQVVSIAALAASGAGAVGAAGDPQQAEVRLLQPQELLLGEAVWVEANPR